MGYFICCLFCMCTGPHATGTAAEDDKEKMMRTVDTFQGFLDCLENPTIKGVIFGLGVWHVGEIKGNPAMQEAYETGKRV